MQAELLKKKQAALKAQLEQFLRSDSYGDLLRKEQALVTILSGMLHASLEHSEEFKQGRAHLTLLRTQRRENPELW
jgi:hypothetical protein